MKAVISDRIYLDIDPQNKKKIDRALTYAIPSFRFDDPPIMIKNMGTIREDLITIPSGCITMIPYGYDIIDKRILKPVEFPTFKYELRPSQQEVYEEVEDSSIINAWVSWGKTITALAISKKLGQKTLIVTHTTNLRNQWEKEVFKAFGIPAGRIGSGMFQTGEFICVGNIQTLYRRIPDVKQLFGTVILDEMHHVSAPTFARIIDEMPARYKIGLTGTLERKDGRHVIFRDYFGHNVLKPPKENYMTPKVNIIKSEVRFLDGSYTPWAERINHLVNTEEYVHSISLIASKYAAEGHKVLVVSDRVAFLKVCHRLVGNKSVCITGEMDFVEREKTMKLIGGSKNILFGTQAIFSEGISLDDLSCLVLATPVNNEPLLTQLIGRIIRQKEGKLQPTVVDIHLKGKTATRQANARMGYYIKQDYKVKVL